MPRQMQTLRDLRVRRETMEIARALYNRAQQGADRALATLSNHSRRVEELTELALTDDDSLAASVGELREEHREIEWLWDGWVPRGRLTLLVAEPGVGKSALALHLTACAFGERPWPDGTEPAPNPGPTLFCDTEGNQSQLLDRIGSWDLSDEALVIWKQARMPFDLQSDECLMRAERMIEELDCPMMIVDTLRGAFDGDENSSEVGRMLGQWQEMTSRTNTALVVVHHERKAQKGERGGDLNCVRGSSALTATPKCIIRLSRADRVEGRVRVKVIKSNLAPIKPELVMVQRDDGLHFALDDVAATPPLKTELAQRLLLAELGDGPKPAAELVSRATSEGISETTLQRAANELGVAKTPVTLPDGTREYLWEPPAGLGPACAESQDPEVIEEEDPFDV
jgi:hypothetical protein